MLADLLALPMVVPLVGGLLLIPLHRRIRLQRVAAAIAMGAVLVLVVALAIHTRNVGMLVYQLGDWPAPFGITFALDLFPALLMIMTMVTGNACLYYSMRTIGGDKERHFYYALFLIITGAINGAFLTGDLFNLFVFFEIVLITSYLLLSLGSRPQQLSETLKFLVMNALSAGFFLFGIALLYRVTGTLNLADIAIRVAAHPDQRFVTLVAMVFLFAFGVKAAIVPLYFWLPRTYAEAPTAVTAYLGEVGTKVGVYAIYRVFTLVFIHEIAFTHTLIMWIAALTMLVGVLGAIAQMDFKRLLAFHIVSQIGYMIFGLAFFTRDPALAGVAVIGVAGGIIHIVHHMAAKPALFLLAGATEQITGTTSLKKMHGLIASAPALAFAFFLGGLSLTGVPPTSGFFSKFFLVQAGFRSGDWVPAAVAVGVSLLTLFSMMKIFRLVYWGEPMELRRGMPERFKRRFLWPGATLVSVGLVMGFGANVLIDYTSEAARQLLEPARYVEAVLGSDAAAQFDALLAERGRIAVGGGAHGP
jgi:multicomponent Na+:H+ antiporter subunit D